MNAPRPLRIRYVGLVLLLACSGCYGAEQPSGTSTATKKKAVTVGHLAWIYTSLGPYWEPPGDEQQLKDFDEALEPDVTGHQNHQK